MAAPTGKLPKAEGHAHEDPGAGISGGRSPARHAADGDRLAGNGDALVTSARGRKGGSESDGGAQLDGVGAGSQGEAGAPRVCACSARAQQCCAEQQGGGGAHFEPGRGVGGGRLRGGQAGCGRPGGGGHRRRGVGGGSGHARASSMLWWLLLAPAEAAGSAMQFHPPARPFLPRPLLPSSSTNSRSERQDRRRPDLAAGPASPWASRVLPTCCPQSPGLSPHLSIVLCLRPVSTEICVQGVHMDEGWGWGWTVEVGAARRGARAPCEGQPRLVLG